MRIVYLNYEDRVGKRFNGYDLMNYYNHRGHSVSLFVWDKRSNSNDVIECLGFNSFIRKVFRRVGTKLGDFFGLPSMFYPFILFYRKLFLRCDIVHLHLLNNYYFNIFELPIVCFLKPTVITIHEFSPLTSHCIYPAPNCDKWKIACYGCPDRERPFPIYRKSEGVIWNIKKILYSISKFEIIVASDWMKKNVEASPLLGKSKVTIIPFGVDHNVFSPVPADVRKKKREDLGIEKGRVVIFLRALDSVFKNFKVIVEAFELLEANLPICILTVQDKGLFRHLSKKFQVIDIGLVIEEKKMAELFSVSDMFLMPSSYETFGMMAVEAMASEVPPIVCRGTVLEEVTMAPEGGALVNVDDPKDLALKIKQLVFDREYREELGRKARSISLERYSFGVHAERMMDFYKDYLSKSKKGLISD